MASKMSALQGEAHFFEESMNPMKVKEYLSRPKVSPSKCVTTAAESAQESEQHSHNHTSLSESEMHSASRYNMQFFPIIVHLFLPPLVFVGDKV